MSAPWNKPRLLYFAWTPPNRRSGACLAMRRHLIEHDDFEVLVATDGEPESEDSGWIRLKRPDWLQRVMNTRFCRLVRQFEMAVWSRRIPAAITDAVREFQPEAIFTVPDNTLSWAAARLATRLRLPLIANFQDWWPRCLFYYPHEKPCLPVRNVLESRFRAMHHQSKVVFCTSEGMQQFLGPHRDSHILYPIGAKVTPTQTGCSDPASAGSCSNKLRRLLYAGTTFGSYGVQLRALLRGLKSSREWKLEIFGPKPDWPAEELAEAEELGVYHGFVPFETLTGHLRSADALLVVMSFDPELEIMMRTSFTTKMLDYSNFAKPIIVWGPPFCSPIQLARKEQAALPVDVNDPEQVIQALHLLVENRQMSLQLGKAAARLSQTVFRHEAIHQVLVSAINQLLRPQSGSWTSLQCSVPAAFDLA